MATTYAASTLEVLAATLGGLVRAPVLDRHAPGPGVCAEPKLRAVLLILGGLVLATDNKKYTSKMRH